MKYFEKRSQRKFFRSFHLFMAWAERNAQGRIFDSSGGFNLPHGATRSPDIGWRRNEKLEQLTDRRRVEQISSALSGFVLELRSPSNSLRLQQEKMEEEYISNGALLGWPLDLPRKWIHICLPGVPPEILEDPQELSGESPLPGFVLPVRQKNSRLSLRSRIS